MPLAPVGRLKKSEIVWLANHYCKHSHTYLTHYNCYLAEVVKNPLFQKKHGEDIPMTQKIGYFDIETSNLKANFGIMFCYCIKDNESNKIHERLITKKELETCLDKRVVEQCITDLKKFDKIVTYYGCVTPGNRVLTADLGWVPVEKLTVGDKLLSINENINSFSAKRWFTESEVVHNIPVKKDIYAISLEDGTYLEASGDHPWFVKRANTWTWKRTDELIHPNGKNEMQRLTPTWAEDKSYEAGYVSAIIDGEGCISQATRKDRNDFTFIVSATQNDNSVLEKYTKCLDKLGIDYSVRQYDKKHPSIRSVTILGRKADKLKFLGMIKPSKLETMQIDKLGGATQYDTTPIVSVKRLGESTVMGLGTTSSTYIVEGFGSHNTRFDLPFVRTRALYHNIPFPFYKELLHSDVYYMVRNKFCLHRNRLEVAYNALIGDSKKTHFNEAWLKAMTGNKKALQFILDHCRIDVKELEELYKRVDDFTMKSERSI